MTPPHLKRGDLSHVHEIGRMHQIPFGCVGVARQNRRFCRRRGSYKKGRGNRAPTVDVPFTIYRGNIKRARKPRPYASFHIHNPSRRGLSIPRPRADEIHAAGDRWIGRPDERAFRRGGACPLPFQRFGYILKTGDHKGLPYNSSLDIVHLDR